MGSVPRTSVDVAVIGAGAIGLAVAVQARLAGVGSVIVVEAASVAGAGSTGRANGGVRAQFANALNVVFSEYTIRELALLDERTGGLVGYRPVGYLLLAGDTARADALVRAAGMQRTLGVPVELLTPAQVSQRAPFVRVDGLRAASFCGSDGVIDPHGVVSALAMQGQALGVRYRFDAEVRAIEHDGTRALMRCNGCELSASWVVNATGARARDVAALAGLELPVLPYRRNLACTEAIAGIPAHIPMCVDLDTGLLIRREAAGMLVAYSDPDDPPSSDTAFDPTFLDAVALRAPHRFPFLSQAGIDRRKCWAGLYPETPDHNAIIDAPPGLPWFIQCNGFGGHGIMHCVAAGRAVAELIRDQRCSAFDLVPLRLSRFAEGPLEVETAVL